MWRAPSCDSSNNDHPTALRCRGAGAVHHTKSDLTRRSTDRRYSITSSARARRGSNSVVAAFRCEKSWSGTSRFARVQGTAFCPLKKVIRPAPPALGHSGNRKQPVGFMAITGVDAKYMPNGEIMIGSLDHPDLVSGPHITLDDDS